MKAFRAFLAQWLMQSLIAFDQLVNALLTPPFTGRVGYADETLSARTWRTWRAARGGKWMAKLTMPVIDLMFRWQGYPNHCERAYEKEMQRRNLPPEYRP